jgi:hypothetical protein
MKNIFYKVVKKWFKLSSWEQNVMEIFKKEEKSFKYGLVR